MELDHLIGRRVALRHRVGERDGRPLYSDAVGELSTSGADVVVQTRRGPVRVARSAVTAVRAVPPAPPKRASLTAVARLEGLCADAWPALVDERLGAWRLRAAGGFTGRANSALAAGDPGVPVAAALQRVQAFAAAHAIAPRVQVPSGTPWDRRVAQQGWVLDERHAAGAEVSVQVADLAQLGRRVVPTRGVSVDRAPGGAWWALVAPGGAGAAARHVLTAVPDAGFITAGEDGALRAVVVEDHLHLSVLQVREPVRRRGLATALTVAAARWGHERGAHWTVLQVARRNAAALALYAGLGFTEHHGYRYLVPDGAAPPSR